MTVGFKLGSIVDEVGSQDFLHSFFSTISYRLETKGWGSNFPVLLNNLYQGSLKEIEAEQALIELEIIESGLKKLSTDQVVWRIEEPSVKPPWGDDISNDITDLSNYFVTSTGRNLMSILKEAIVALRDEGGEIKIVTV